MSAAFSPSGFFAIRSPLLPLAELTSWSAGLEAPLATENHDDAVTRDRAVLRARLRAIIDRPQVREALFVASPSLYESLPLWRSKPDGDRGQRVERALVRYFCRAAGRPTPFGLFAGCSTGTIGERTRLRLAGIDRYERRSRLDVEYLDALVESLASDPSIRGALVHRVNSSLHRAGGQIRYVEPRIDGTERRHLLVTAEESDELIATLARAVDGATPAELAAGLVGDEITEREALAFVDELIDGRILVSELGVTVTGADSLGCLVDRLAARPESRAAHGALTDVRAAHSAIDASGVGGEVERYR